MYTEYDKTIAIPIDEEGVMDYENDIIIFGIAIS